MKMQLVEVRLENWRARMEDGVAYLAAVRAGGRWRYYGSDNAPRFCDADDLAIFGQALWMSDRVPDTRYDAWSRFIRMWEEGRSEK